jgi:rubrerythrin
MGVENVNLLHGQDGHKALLGSCAFTPGSSSFGSTLPGLDIDLHFNCLCCLVTCSFYTHSLTHFRSFLISSNRYISCHSPTILFRLHSLNRLNHSLTPRLILNMSRTWTCCQCNAANIKDLATRCPICEHDHCDKCTSSPPTLFDTEDMLSSHEFSNDNNKEITEPDDAWSANSTEDDAATPVQPVSVSRPNMAGYWFCHMCNQFNHPVNCPEVCFNCGHHKCIYCSKA